jgi:hypothetical protein
MPSLSDSRALECPYCGEEVEVAVDGVGAGEEQYVEDCPVCCRPWTVSVSRDGDEVYVQLSRSDD